MFQDALLQQSAEFEAQNNLKKALDYRVRALDEYVAILKGELDGASTAPALFHRSFSGH